MSDKGVDTDMEGETIMEMEAKEVGMEVEDMEVEEMEAREAVDGMVDTRGMEDNMEAIRVEARDIRVVEDEDMVVEDMVVEDMAVEGTVADGAGARGSCVDKCPAALTSKDAVTAALCSTRQGTALVTSGGDMRKWLRCFQK